MRQKRNFVMMFLMVCMLIFSACQEKENEKEEATDFSEEITLPTKADGTRPTFPVDKPQTTQPVKQKDVTVMVYMVGSNLEHDAGFATDDLFEMLELNDFSNINVVVQTGGCSDWKNTLVKDGEVQRYLLAENKRMITLSDLGKISMLTTETLADFISFSAENYPAEKYILVMWDHGGGIPISFGMDDMFPEDSLEEYEIRDALKKAGVHFETIAFDACNMSTLEIAMAIKDHADFMVAAESIASGCGLNYTAWLKSLIADKGSLKYTEKMVDSYMEDIRRYQAVGTMSVISLDKVQKVFDTYAVYLSEVYSRLLAGDYTNFKNVRQSFSEFDSIDSVDLLALVNGYKTSHSSQVMNEVVNAIRYTVSDYSEIHGLAAYFPSNFPNQYYLGRDSFIKLNYDESVVKFYDNYVSMMMHFSRINYAQYTTWYKDDLVKNARKYSYPLNTEVKNELFGSDWIIKLKMEDWDYINNVTADLWSSPNEDTTYYWGNDYYNQQDAFYNMVMRVPDHWTMMNDRVCVTKYIARVYDNVTKAKSDKLRVYAYVNGDPAMIILLRNCSTKECRIAGYYQWDIDNAQPVTGSLERIQPEDEITCIYLKYDDKVKSNVWTPGSTYKASEVQFSYKPVKISQFRYFVDINMENIYGDTYTATHTFDYRNK